MNNPEYKETAERITPHTMQFLIRLKTNNQFWYAVLLEAAAWGPKDVKKVIDNLYEHRKHIFEFDRRGLNIFEICLFVREYKDQLALIPDDVWQATRTRSSRVMQKRYQDLVDKPKI